MSSLELQDQGANQALPIRQMHWDPLAGRRVAFEEDMEDAELRAIVAQHVSCFQFCDLSGYLGNLSKLSWLHL